MRRAGRALVVVLLLVLAGCSTVPSSSPTVQITQEPARGGGVVGIEPLEPEPGATPEEIVRGFIDAAASIARGHPIARMYLAPDAAGSWSDETGITVIGPDYATVTTDAGTVAVTADLAARVDPRGVLAIGGRPAYTAEFSLVQVAGEWRITNPPDGLLMLQPDFERLYDQRAVYFVDPTGQRVVPDLRHLIAGEAQATQLVNRLLAGPSPAVAPGVGNALDGAELRRSVTVSGSTITVDLSGVADLAPPQLAQLCAQLVWTLQPLPAPSVEILVDGEPLRLDGVPAQQTVDDWSTFGPESAPVGAVGHYLSGGALRVADGGGAAPGPAGAGAHALDGAAVAVDVRTGELTDMVGTTSAGGPATLLAGPYGGELTPVLTGATLTVPTVSATRAEFWVVRDGTGLVRVPADGTPQAVGSTSLEGLGQVSVLQLSPDGVRAALVVAGPSGSTLYVGTVVRGEEGSVALRELRPIAPALSQVVDVAWATAGRLLVLAAGTAQEGTVPYSLTIDGWGLATVATAGLPGQPTAIAAAPGQQPLVSAGGTVWQLSGGTWVTLVRGQQPLSGTEPFYPA